MPAGQIVQPSLVEEEFLLQALRTAALRTDGRKFNDARQIRVQFGEQLGWCKVNIGDTCVIASVSAEIVPPREQRPYEGMIQIVSDISPMAGVEHDAGSIVGGDAREREALFDRLVERALRRSEAVDRESLCIIAGKSAWCITITVHLLANQGAALDATILASMIALRHFRRPDVSVEDGQVIVHSTDERIPVPLSFHHTPLCVSYAVFIVQPQDDEQRHLIASHSGIAMREEGALADDDDDEEFDLDMPIALRDPSLLEESLAHSLVTFVVNAQREVCVLDKAGGASLPYQALLSMLQDAAVRAGELSALVEEALHNDAQTRIISVE
ncbi:3'-5'-exoribonuclease [Malassezia cuniculi]|uniref:3'-5'-exoribonuclease n=1 Tax=Malassezia cuniculi TaxID=948313 RepID=A0AAF0EWR1_9BASI|nr:3'-5'-exoribonuclease [Malassezia cuniculi]